jgi:hypothetical protein
MKSYQIITLTALVLCATSASVSAQSASPKAETTSAATASSPAATSKKTSIAELVKLKQNPVSGLRQVGLDMSLNPDMPHTGGTEGVYSTQVVWPFRLNDDWRLISYTILPVLQVPEGDGDYKVGLGNTLLNFYVAASKPDKLVWGIGPAILLPTRSDPILGSDRLGLGPSGVLYYAEDKWGAGVVLQNVWSMGGEGINEVNVFSAQYFLNYNLPKGWYLYSNASITADWLADDDDDTWTVPVGGGVGRIFNIGNQPVDVAIQGLYNTVRPSDAADWTINLQISLLFP